MDLGKLDPRFREVVEGCESFLVSHAANLGALDLAPFGLEIPPARRFSPTSLGSLDVVEGLHRLDAAAFGGQGMR
jgi:hypothetical protein